MADISVIGLGQLGLPLAAALATEFQVIGIDIDEKVVRDVRMRRVLPWIQEPNLETMLDSVGSNLDARTSMEWAATTDISIVLVQTPSKPDGGFSLKYVLDACAELGNALRHKEGYHVVIVASTVMPGSCDGPIRATLEAESGKRAGKGFGLCYCPEFVALGNAIDGFLNPDFVVIGSSNPRTAFEIGLMYKRFCTNNPPIYHMSLVSAEIVKIGLNVAIVSKMVMAAQITWMCQRYPGADSDEVLRAIGGDRRIGRAFFSKILWPGGPCFPRDGRAFVRAAQEVGQFVPVMEAVTAYLGKQVEEMAALVDQYANGKQIGILGLTYKAGVNSIVGSYGLALADKLTKMGQKVRLCDPHVPECYGEKTASLEETVAISTVLIVAVDHPEFKILESLDLSGKVVVDCRGFLDESKISGEYVRQGRGT